MPVFSRLAVAVQLFAVFLSPVLGAAATKEYDYVIVGGGVTGLIVANRITEDKTKTVLVIEAGDSVDDYATEVPYEANSLTSANGLIWENIYSTPEPGVGNASFEVVIAKVLGGGSVINGMVYDRGSAADYNAWEALGNPGWGWDGMLPFFIKGTTFQPPTPEVVENFNITWNPDVYGDGPLAVSITSNQYEDINDYWAAWKASGVFVPEDGNAGQAYGPSWYGNTMNATDGRRAHARYAYYDPIKAVRNNLKIMTGTTVNEILFNNNKKTPMATGVEATDASGNCFTVSAKKEVVLAAGAINTAKLLQLSGIGPKSVLKAAGIDVKVELDAVGANFQDHAYATIVFNTTDLYFPNQNSLTTNATFNASSWEQYEVNHTGPYTYARGNALAFIPLPEMTDDVNAVVKAVNKQKDTDYLPSIYKTSSKLRKGFAKQRKVLTDIFQNNEAAVVEFPVPADGSYGLVGVEKPLSRGTVFLNASDPTGPPTVAWNAFVNPVDRTIMSIGLRFFRTIWASPLLAAHDITETVPGAQYTTDTEIYDALLAQGMLSPTLAHVAGTCQMMPEADGGCVSPELLVYGTSRLSVIDTSIIPIIPSCHLQATAYGIGEKAASIIKSR